MNLALGSRVRKIALGAGALGVAVAGLGVSASPAGATHVVHYTASCGTLFGNYSFAGSLQNSPPASVTNGTAFTVPGNRITIVIPGPLVSAAYAAGARSFKGKLTIYNISSSDATPASFNAAGTKGINIPATNLPSNGAPLTLYVPGRAKTFTIGGMTAGSTGTDQATLGSSTSTVEAYSGTGGTGTALFSNTSSCSAPTPAAVAWSIPVS